MRKRNILSKSSPVSELSNALDAKLRLGLWAIICALVLSADPAEAGVIELSGSFAFSNTNLGDSNYEWSRHWTASVGYYFWGLSEIQYSVEDVVNRTSISGVEDTTFHDQIYSLDWIQYFAHRTSLLVPFIKVGVGQLDRDASGQYWAGGAPPAIYDSLTAVLGLGLKVTLSENFSVHGEATTYLTNGDLSTWQDNCSFNFGVSVYLF